VSIGASTHTLEQPFMVLATQNPIEQDGTYTLPEAQLDRFLIKTIVSYPSRSEEIDIMKQSSNSDNITISSLLSREDIVLLQKQVTEIHVAENIYSYVADIVSETRDWELSKYLAYGASPRASIALVTTAKAHALLQWRDHVEPEDIKAMSYAVLRHRIVRNYEAIADGISSDNVIDMILKKVAVR